MVAKVETQFPYLKNKFFKKYGDFKTYYNWFLGFALYGNITFYGHQKRDFDRIGGFPEWIEGWGGEDIVVGFLACAANIPIELSECVSYQTVHRPYSGSEEAK